MKIPALLRTELCSNGSFLLKKTNILSLCSKLLIAPIFPKMSDLTYLAFARRLDRAMLSSCFTEKSLSTRERSEIENAVFDTLHSTNSSWKFSF